MCVYRTRAFSKLLFKLSLRAREKKIYIISFNFCQRGARPFHTFFDFFFGKKTEFSVLFSAFFQKKVRRERERADRAIFIRYPLGRGDIEFPRSCFFVYVRTNSPPVSPHSLFEKKTTERTARNARRAENSRRRSRRSRSRRSRRSRSRRSRRRKIANSKRYCE